MKRTISVPLLSLFLFVVGCGDKAAQESTAKRDPGSSSLCKETGAALDGVVILEAKDTGSSPSVMDTIAAELEAECTSQKADEKSRAALECYAAHAKDIGYRMFKSCPQDPAKALVAAVVAKHGGPKDGPAARWPSMSGEPAASAAPSATPAAGTSSVAASPSAVPSSPTGQQYKATVRGVEAVKPLVELILADAGMADFALTGPEGATVRKGLLGAEVTSASVNYSVAIREGAFASAAAKQTFASLDPKGKLVTDTPELVLFQRESGAFLFSMAVNVGDEKFTCGTVATAVDFDRAMVDQMIESCRTLKRVSGTPRAADPIVSGNGNSGATPTVGKPSTKPPVTKPACNCAKGDLMCNMRCNAKK